MTTSLSHTHLSSTFDITYTSLSVSQNYCASCGLQWLYHYFQSCAFWFSKQYGSCIKILLKWMCKFFFNFYVIFNMYIVLTFEWINQYLKYLLLDMGWVMVNPLLSRFGRWKGIVWNFECCLLKNFLLGNCIFLTFANIKLKAIVAYFFTQ